MSCTHCGADTPGDHGPCLACSPPPTPSAAGSLGTLTVGVSSTPTGPLLPAHPPAARFAPGTAFGDRYTIVEEVGAGGMGLVYKALDRRLGKTVALKLIHAETAARPELRQRFRRELALAQGITHANVCRVHDLGEVEGVAYISMEHVEGQTLSDLIRSVGLLSPKQTLALARQICAGLRAIHEQGVVHRDLKPGNIMVDRAGRAIVMDFGMATQRGNDQLTGAGAVVGTLAYLSPEQAQGRPVDARSDVYAVGLILFEMLTGRRPPGDAGPLPLALRDSAEPCPPPSRLAAEVPAALDGLVLRCLERAPERRFESAAALERDLQRLEAEFSTQKVRAVRSVPEGVTGWRPRMKPTAVVAAVLIVIAATGGLYYAWRPSDRPARGRTVVAVLPLANLGLGADQEYVGVGIADALITQLASLPEVTVVSRSATLRYRDAAAPTPQVVRDLGADYVVQGSVQRAGDTLRVTLTLVRKDDSVAWADRYEGTAQGVFPLQARVAEALSTALQVHVAPAQRERLTRLPSRDEQAFADYARARTLLERPDVTGNVERSIGLFEQALRRDPGFALARAGLAEAQWARYRQLNEPGWAARALGSAEEAVRLDPGQPRTRFALALILHGMGHAEDALAELQRVLAMQPGNDDAHRLRGEILEGQGRWDEAIAELRKALELHPDYWMHYSSLGRIYFRAGRYPDAIAALEKATALQPDNSRGFQMLGTVHQAAGHDQQAIENYRRALALAPDARAYTNLGTIHYSRGNAAEAARAFEEAARLEPGTPAKHRNLGDAYRRLGQPDKARAAYQRAVELSEQALSVNPSDARVMANLAVYKAKLGQNADASRLAQRAIGLRADDGEVLYCGAVVHALAGRQELALASLQTAIERGFSRSLAASDEDLSRIRSSARYAVIIGRSH